MLRHKIMYAALAGVALVGFSPQAEAGRIGVLNATTNEYQRGTPVPISAQSVSARGLTELLGTFTTGGANNGFMIVIPDDNPRGIGFEFYVELNVDGAEFSGESVDATVHTYTASETDGNAIEATESSGNGCTATVARTAHTIKIRACNSSTTPAAARAVNVTGMTFVRTAALATAGNSITLSGRFRAEDDDELIEEIPPVAIITSKNEFGAHVRAGSLVTIDPNVTPPFSRISATPEPTTMASLGTINLADNQTVRLNGTGTEYEATGTSTEVTNIAITVDHGVLSDSALASITLDAPDAATHTDESITARALPDRLSERDGTLTFGDISQIDENVANAPTVPGTMGGSNYGLSVTFNGRTPISAHDPGLATVTFKGANQLANVPDAVRGPLATFKRGGLSAQVNSARNSVGNGSTQYQSILRIANNGSNAAAVTITLYDASDGEMLGSWASDMIEPKGMLQISVAQLEDGIGLNPTDIGFYTIDIDGPLNGYVQHVNWNSLDNLFTDLSGFRVGAGTNVTEP